MPPTSSKLQCGSGKLAMVVRLVFCFLLGCSLPARAVVPWSLSINTNNVVNSGAVGDGISTNTAAIQSAINLAARGGQTNSLLGGVVEIPAAANAYLCGPLCLSNHVCLQIDAGAILRMLPFSDYPGGTVNPSNFVTGSSLQDIEITGPGAIDGQGAPWWPYANTNGAVRPSMIVLTDCNREMIQNITLSNSPMFHISIGGGHPGNTTVQGVTVRAPSSSDPITPSHNTDACDVSGTNVLVQNCNISTGDDDFTCGGGTHDVLLTNNVYGNGHGISIGSFTDSGGVSNITVINCTINGADNGIRIKSDNNRGGLVQNINYYNIGITNVHFPIQVYAYYNEFGTPSGISPFVASTQTVASVTSLTPIYRNITFSNITATSVSGYPIGLIWARTELPATNIIFNKVNVTGNRNFDLYNVVGAQFIDCNLAVSAKSNTFALFDAQPIISNSAPSSTLFTFDGLTTNGYGNTLALYSAQGALSNTNALDKGPLTLSASTFTVSNDLSLVPSTVLNFTLSTNTTRLAVVGNLMLGGTNNISAGPGFSNGVYTLMTYTGTLNGSVPTLGSVPVGYDYAFDSGTAGQVNLIVRLTAPTNLLATATNLQINLNWNSVTGASSYNLKRGTTSGGPYPTIFSALTGTNYADAAVTNAVNYFYVVSAVGAGGESTNSVQASAVPLPSNQPTNIILQASSGQVQLSWPQDHLGWRLQMQTNAPGSGLGTNWVTVANSTNVTSTNIVINPAYGSAFFRLIYP